MREHLHDRVFNSWKGAETHRFDCVCLGQGIPFSMRVLQG